jgi:ABC-type multidrug transport system fused ATPase/permease subunit
MKWVSETFPLECSLARPPRTFAGFLRVNFWSFFGYGFVFYALFYIVSRAGFSLFPAVQMRMLADLLDNTRENFWHAVLVVLAVVLAANLFFKLCDLAQNMIWQRVRPNSRKAITLNLVNYLHCQSMGFINEKMLGKLSQQVNNISFNSALTVQKLFADMGSNLVTVLVGLALTTQLHWSLAVVVAAGAAVRLLWFRVTFPKMISTNRLHAQTVSQMHGAITDTLGNSMNVRVFSGRMKELRLLSKIMDKYGARFQDHYVADRKFWVPLSFMEEFVFIFVAALCVWYFHIGTIDLGQVVFMLGAFVSINSSLWNFMFKWTELFETGTEVAQNYAELNARISVGNKTGSPELKVSRGEIEFDDVDFRYDKKSPVVLSDFSLKVSGGEHVGIVGASGGGKSTVIKLLMRLYDVNGGSIKIDGQNIAKVSLHSLRKNIAFIPQDTSLFNRSILENLKYARDQASFTEIREAAGFAGAHDFIKSQPNGYNMIVGDRGIKLSGGQRQRIAIARAFLQNARILLIDEATSALDSETEEIIQKNLEKISRGRTTLVVAHRLSTLSKMDRIIVLQGGRIAESGTHAQLVRKRGGIYAKMWKNQSGGFLN